MNQLVFKNNNGEPVTTSLKVAEQFHKSHKNVLRGISNLSCSEEFRRLNFEPRDYIDARGKVQPMYEMTKNGFLFLVLGYNGQKAGETKEKYIAAFDSLVELVVKQDTILKNDDAIVARAFEIINGRNKELLEENEKQKEIIEKAEKKIEIAHNRLEAVAPKVEFANRIHESEELYEFKKVAKILQLPFGRNILFRKLRADGVLMKNNEPYQQYINQGYFVHKLVDEIPCMNPNTQQEFIVKNYQTFSTGKGMFWLSQKYEGRNPIYRNGSTSLPTLF